MVSHLLVSALFILLSRTRDDPYDQVIFPHDQNVAPGRPNFNVYDFNTDHSLGKELSREILERIDPGNEFLLKQCQVWMELATIINKGFTALGSKRVTPPFLHFLLSKKVNQLYKLASYSVMLSSTVGILFQTCMRIVQQLLQAMSQTLSYADSKRS